MKKNNTTKKVKKGVGKKEKLPSKKETTKITSKTKISLVVTILIIVVLVFSLMLFSGTIFPKGETKMTQVKLETNKGNIIIELYDTMPITAGNFKKLVSEGFYDGVIFHRVIPDFMIQGGDPTGTGTGGPGYRIEDEFVEGSSNIRGTISMANAGPNTGGSQFFINIVDNTFLDWDKQPASSKHPVFGKVIEGMDIVDAISLVSRDSRDKPLEDVVIIKATILN